MRAAVRDVVLAALALLVATGLAFAQPASPPGFAADDTALDAIRRTVDETQKALVAPDKLGDAELRALGTTLAQAEAQAAEIAARLGPNLAELDARIAQLGTPAAGAREDADVVAQRGQLAKNRSAADGQLRLARLLMVEAGQATARLAGLRRAEFQARLGERTDSILSARFWSALASDLPSDLDHLAALGRRLGDAARRTPPAVRVAAPLAALLAGGVLAWAMRRAMAWLQVRAPAGRLRRSLHAALTVAGWTLAFGLVASALRAVVDARGTLVAADATLVAQVGALLWFGGFVYGLSTAVICADKPSWRLMPLPDAVAARLAHFPWLLTATSLVSWTAERLAGIVDASLSVTVAVQGLVALGVGLTVGSLMVGAERQWRHEFAAPGAGGRPLWLAGLGIGSWVLLGVAIVSLLAGYVALGSFVVKQVVWSGIVLGGAYLLAVLVDDLAMAWLPGVSPAGSAPAPGTPPARISAQFAVLASGVLRFALGLVALMLLLAPFGEGPAELLRRGLQTQQGLSIGEFRLQPGAVLQALGVLLVGLGLLRLLRRWLVERYLPTTALDAGMQASTTSLFGYLGVVVAVAAAMSALGIGLERIAWVASALSVGIGFGLQAVVQNFVSGLILLAERPVKVGDWVSLGGVEGDIRRINVRATEIQQGDRSTVIVPNSEFITKTVRNVTLANPLGLVQLKLPLPFGTDAERVRTLLLAIFEAHEQVLAEPAPGVALDGIEAGQLVFNATGFVDSPRKAYDTRSALLFEVLKRFAAEGIALAKPPTMLLGNLPGGDATRPT